MEGIWTNEGDWSHGYHDGCMVRIRFGFDEAGRQRPVEVILSGQVTPETLRTLPLRSIEAIRNRRRIPEHPSIVLRIPEGPMKKPDEFYRRVAAAYEFLAETTQGPAQAIADANDVPVTTVHRWVKEARARGLLAPGQKGRAT